MREILTMALAVLLVFSVMAGAVSYSMSDTGVSEEGAEDSKEKRSSGGGEEVKGLADSSWPMFGYDPNHTRRS